MVSKEELKEIDIKNRACYYFDDIIRDIDIYFDDFLLNKKSYKNKYENILIHDISEKTLMGAKPLRIRFNNIDDLLKFMMELDI